MVPDYYAMLGVEPRADRAELEAALEKSRHQWSSGTRNPKYKHTYQSYLDQVPEIRRRVLGDPSARAAYDAELAAEAAESKQTKLDELQRLVRLRAAKGGLTVSDRAILRDRAIKLGLTGDDLAKLIEPIPPRPEPPAEVEQAESQDGTLDPVTRRQILAALHLVGSRDLYDALGLARDAPASEVAARADAERQRWMRKSQVTAEKTAWLEVVSYAQSHLGQADGRARYDRSLTIDAEEEFERTVVFAIEGLQAIDPGTRHVLIDEASARGIEADRADRLIVRTCKSLGVSRDAGLTASPAPGTSSARYLRCRSCGGVVNFGRVGKNPDQGPCPHCRASLRWECPVCRKGHWVDEPRCPCKFEVKNLEPLIRHFEAAQHANKARDYEGALGHLERIQEYAPHHVGARKAIEKIHGRLAEIAAVKAEFDLARGRCRLVTARQALVAWSRLVDPASPVLLAAQAELVAELREGQRLVAKAKAVEPVDPIAAREFYRRALTIAADLTEARDGLRRSPPDPPTSLRADLAGDAVVLRWTPPASDGLGPCTYRVVRKVGGIPTRFDDGTLVAEVVGSEASDREATSGHPVGYATFTVRGGITSATGATLAPFSFLLDVRDLRAEGSHGEINLSWTLPAGAVGAKVVRLVGPGGVDRSIDSLADNAVDRGLDDSRIYRYRVSASYRGPDGKAALAPGVEIAATPAAAATPVGPPTLQLEADGRVELRWAAVPRGTIKVLRTAAPIPHPAGSRIASVEANRLDGTWLENNRADGSTDPRPPAVGVCHYTPIVFLNGAATIGMPIGYSSVPDPTDLRAVRIGSAGQVHLRWRWTSRATETIIVARQGGPPRGPDEPDAIVSTVNESDYSRQGKIALHLPVESSGAGPWHLAVFSVAIVDGMKIVSPGLEPTARTVVPGPNPEVTVAYSLRRPSFPGRPWAISFRTDPPGSTVPAMVLVAHSRTVPLSVDDGEIVERFPSCRDGDMFNIKPRVDLSRQRARLFADPSVDPSGIPPIRVKHPESAATRV